MGSRALLLEHGVNMRNPPAGTPRGASQVYVARAGRLLGSIRIADVLRPEAKQAVAAMRRMGVRTVLLSGDTQAATTCGGPGSRRGRNGGRTLAGTEGEVGKGAARKGRKVAMVGDGINDAPALVEADVGIAMGREPDVARESADIILIGNDLSKFVETLRIARRCRASSCRIRRNPRCR